MRQNDATEAFLKSLPELKNGQTFRFGCGPGVSCFNACCGDLNLSLTPYDVLRLRRALAMNSADLVHGFTQVSTERVTGFPFVHLRMLDNAKRSCPFVRPEGCSVYQDRPGACRTYPLGRASKAGPFGSLEERFFIVREAHCRGFEQGREWTSGTWLKDQGLKEYSESNDRFIKLVSRWKTKKRPLDAKQANMVFLALYQADDFQRFIRDMGLFKRLILSAERQRLILDQEEACLEFAFDWLELVLSGQSEKLAHL